MGHIGIAELLTIAVLPSTHPDVVPALAVQGMIGRCGTCGTMRAFWVVRDGRSMCAGCDGVRQRNGSGTEESEVQL